MKHFSFYMTRKHRRTAGSSSIPRIRFVNVQFCRFSVLMLWFVGVELYIHPLFPTSRAKIPSRATPSIQLNGRRIMIQLVELWLWSELVQLQCKLYQISPPRYTFYFHARERHCGTRRRILALFSFIESIVFPIVVNR